MELYPFKRDINNAKRKRPDSQPAGFSGGTPVYVSLIQEGPTAKLLFTKNRKNRKFPENRKFQPHALFKRTTAGDFPTSSGTGSAREKANAAGSNQRGVRSSKPAQHAN